MKVYIVFWSSRKDHCKYTRVFSNERLAEECCNYIKRLGSELTAYYLEYTVRKEFTEYDKRYFDWRKTL